MISLEFRVDFMYPLFFFSLPFTKLLTNVKVYLIIFFFKMGGGQMYRPDMAW